MNNYKKIRNMTIEEMAEFFSLSDAPFSCQKSAKIDNK